jgi:hypothetical protein
MKHIKTFEDVDADFSEQPRTYTESELMGFGTWLIEEAAPDFFEQYSNDDDGGVQAINDYLKKYLEQLDY